MITTSLPSPLERLQLRERLQDLWREQVEILAVVDYRAGCARATAGTAAVKPELAQQMAMARSVLAEVEAAMQRMDCRSYGICEQCTEPIPTAELFRVPQRRRCPDCDDPAGNSGQPESDHKAFADKEE